MSMARITLPNQGCFNRAVCALLNLAQSVGQSMFAARAFDLIVN